MVELPQEAARLAVRPVVEEVATDEALVDEALVMSLELQAELQAAFHFSEVSER